MELVDAIKKRKSCRSFNADVLKISDRAELEKFINEKTLNLFDESLDLKVFGKEQPQKTMKLDYGMIKGHNIYILGKSKATTDSRVNYGYQLEKVVLKATALGLGTCWVGYFDESYFDEISVEEGYEIPGIVVVGYAQNKQSGVEKLMRFSTKADKRLPWSQLFFHFQTKVPLSNVLTGRYEESFEMVRLAPSAGNTQPWRVFMDEARREFHFFKKPVNEKYEQKGLHDIDMGIALAHFELTSEKNRLNGSWLKHNEELIDHFTDMKYCISWEF